MAFMVETDSDRRATTLILPVLPDAELDDDTAPARQSIFAMLRAVQDEFSADGQNTRRAPPAPLRSIRSVLYEIREGQPVEPVHKVDGPIRLRRIADTLKSFQDDGGEGDE